MTQSTTSVDQHHHRVVELEQQLAARDKTIAVLVARVEHQQNTTSAFTVFEQNLSLEKIVTQKTRELEQKGASLEQALLDLKNVHATLLQAQKLQSIGQLAAGIAHEINTPMQFILDNTVFVREAAQSMTTALRAAQKAVKASTSTEARALDAVFRASDIDYLLGEVPRALDETREGISRVRSIVTAMRNFAHHDAAEFADIDLNENIHTTMTVCRSEWKHVAEVKCTLDDELPRLPAMRDELNQVILNLLVNAADAVREQPKDTGVVPQITIKTRKDGAWAVLEIADSGGGIPVAVRERVFEPFFTTKPVGKGTGQGLAIARSVIEKHQGQMSFVDNDIGGTTFVVRLPLRRTPVEVT